MIQEQYVSFECAKLLKEKGFNEPTLAYCYGEDMIDHFSKPKIVDKDSSAINLPTQSLTMRWLREEKGLFIEIHTFYECKELPFACRYQIISNNKDYESMEDESDECFYTYEEAVEAAITECLECYL